MTKRILSITTTMFLLLSLISCFCVDDNRYSNVDFDSISIGMLDGNGAEGIDESNIIIEDFNSWESLVNQMNTVNEEVDLSATTINFNDYLLLVVFTEIKNSGAQVEITEVAENPNHVVVYFTGSESTFTVMSQPYHIVQIPKTSKPIIFEEQ